MKKTAALILAIVMVFTLTACAASGGASGSTSGDDKTLVIAIQDEIEGADIQQIGWENIVQALIYEPLVVMSPDLTELQPGFAESYKIADDGMSVTFTLPKTSKFSNGEACDAAAVVASFERYMSVSEYASDLAAVKTIEATDEWTVKFTFTEPCAYIWASLTSTYGGIDNVAACEKVGDEAFNLAPVTNGAFYVDAWEQGSQITLKRNEYYQTSNPNVDNHGIANLDTIVIRFIPDEFTRVSELESGNVDLIYDVPTSSVSDLKANKDIALYDYLQAGTSFLNLQTGYGPTEDVLVREALMYAIDRDELVETMDGLVTPIYGYLSEAQTGYSAEKEAEFAKTYAYNPEKAAELLEQAGYKDTDGDGILEKNGEKLSFEFLVPNDRASLQKAGPVLQAQWAKVGIDAQIREYEASYIKSQMKDDKYTVGCRNYVWNDADMLIYLFTPESGYNWESKEVTAAIQNARQVIDSGERVKAYETVQDLLMAQCKAINLFADNYCIAAKSNITGLHVTLDGRAWFNDVAVD